MRKTLLISVAAIALTAASFASAQTPNRGAPAAAPSANQPTTAPAPSSAPADIQATTPEQGKPGATKGAKENTKAPTQRNTQQQQQPNKGTAPSNAQNEPQRGAPTNAQQTNEQRPGTTDRERTGNDRDRSASDRDRPMNSRNVSLTTEQKTTIRTRVLTSSAPRIEGRVNFDIRVGVAVPRTVRVAPLPVELVEIEPTWRGYMYFVNGDEIIVVEPGTLRIVAVLDV